jgi:hypothetical protein
MAILDRLKEYLYGYWEGIGGYWATMPDRGFLSGFLAGIALVLLVLLLLVLRRRRNRCRGVRIAGEGGTLFVSVVAVREFVRRLVPDFPGTSFHSLDLDRSKQGYVFDVVLDVAADTDMPALQAKFSERLRSETGRRLGLEGRVAVVNVTIHRLLPDGKRGRRHPDAAGSERDGSAEALDVSPAEPIY